MKFVILAFLITQSLYASTYKVTNGYIKSSGHNGVEKIINIPYAKPPIGSLRWKAPRKMSFTNEIINKPNEIIKCAQRGNFFSGTGKNKIDKPIGSEDCLYLNIWKPKQDKNNSVFFWIHGGSNKYGYSLDEAYEGSNLANKLGATVVTLNYRLGAFASLYHPKLKTNNSNDNSGNFISQDIIAALDWVRDNAKILDLDVDNITIAGQSAGCINVWSLIYSPLAKNKFKNAICLSGLVNIASTDQAQKTAKEQILSYLKIDNKVFTKMSKKTLREKLEGLTTEEILLAKEPKMPIHHIADGKVINIYKGNLVPLLVGSTEHEGTYFNQFKYLTLTKEQYWDAINGQHPLDDFYAVLQGEKNKKMQNEAAQTTKTVNQTVSSTLSAYSLYQSNIYRFEFQWKSEFTPWKEFYGATHSIDIPFLFNNFTYPKEHFLNFLKKDFAKQSTRDVSNQYIKIMQTFMETNKPSEDKKWLKWSPYWPFTYSL